MLSVAGFLLDVPITVSFFLINILRRPLFLNTLYIRVDRLELFFSNRLGTLHKSCVPM